METVNLNKKVYAKNQYEKVIDTKFSQLATTITPAEHAAQNSSTLSVDQFFQDYQQLFLIFSNFAMLPSVFTCIDNIIQCVITKKIKDCYIFEFLISTISRLKI